VDRTDAGAGLAESEALALTPVVVLGDPAVRRARRPWTSFDRRRGIVIEKVLRRSSGASEPFAGATISGEVGHVVLAARPARSLLELAS
jgi:hypothetical protein